MKKINQLVSYAKEAGSNLTQEDAVNKFVKMKESYSEIMVLAALDKSIQDFKIIANKTSKENWNRIKYELIDAGKTVPTSTNYLKTEIRNGYIDITGIPSEEWVRENLIISL